MVAEGATLGLYEAKRGLFPMGGSAIRLPRQIGYANAMDILLTARSVTPREALAMGLINKIVPDGTALASARELADQIAACGPLAVQGILRTYRETEHLSEEDALKISDEIGWPVIGSEDAKEGSRAFKEKRPRLPRQVIPRRASARALPAASGQGRACRWRVRDCPKRGAGFVAFLTWHRWGRSESRKD